MAKKAKAKWTFMVYMAGDNNLSDAGDRDLAEMRQVGSTPAVNILAEFDNAGSFGTRRFHVLKGGHQEEVKSLGETDSGDPRTLIGFVEWAVKHYPASHYALVLWNHGGGWEPSEVDRIAQAVGAPGYTVREASERSASSLGRAFFRPTLETILSLPSNSERAICSDDGSGHSLDTVELGKVLATIYDKIDGKLDLLGMDACLMSNLEVAYQAQPYVKYIVASEESEPNNGWPYDAVLGELVAHPEQDAADLAAHIVSAYLQSYRQQAYPGDVTQAALDLGKIDALVAPLDGLADALSERLPAAAMALWNAQRKSARFWHNTLWDVAHLCEILELESGDAALAQAASRVRAALQPGKGNFVLAEQHNGDKVGRCGGVSVYLPALTDISRYYQELTFAQQHRWLAMLRKYREE